MDVGATCAWSQHGWQAIGTAKICPELVAKRGTRRGKESLEDCVRQAFLGCPPAFDLDPDPRVPRTGEWSRLVQAPLYGLCFALAFFWLRSPPLH